MVVAGNRLKQTNFCWKWSVLVPINTKIFCHGFRACEPRFLGRALFSLSRKWPKIEIFTIDILYMFIGVFWCAESIPEVIFVLRGFFDPLFSKNQWKRAIATVNFSLYYWNFMWKWEMRERETFQFIFELVFNWISWILIGIIDDFYCKPIAI